MGLEFNEETIFKSVGKGRGSQQVVPPFRLAREGGLEMPEEQAGSVAREL